MMEVEASLYMLQMFPMCSAYLKAKQQPPPSSPPLPGPQFRSPVDYKTINFLNLCGFVLMYRGVHNYTIFQLVYQFSLLEKCQGTEGCTL